MSLAPKFRPMKGDDANLEKVTFPKLLSPKLDGIRTVISLGTCFSSSMKKLPNALLHTEFGKYAGYDGEFILGDPTVKETFNLTSGVIRSFNKPIDGMKLFAFDYVHCDPNLPYYKRLELLKGDESAILVPQHVVEHMDDLSHLEERYVELGYEGVMLRDPEGPYKFGRSTVNEGYLLKWKRFKDAEAVVIGFEEQMHNTNEATINEMGRSKRSHLAAGLVPKNTLGALVVRWQGIEFKIGTGMDDAMRQQVWNHQDLYLGEHCKFKYLEAGMKVAPRHPVFLGWRMKEDM